MKKTLADLKDLTPAELQTIGITTLRKLLIIARRGLSISELIVHRADNDRVYDTLDYLQDIEEGMTEIAPGMLALPWKTDACDHGVSYKFRYYWKEGGRELEMEPYTCSECDKETPRP